MVAASRADTRNGADAIQLSNISAEPPVLSPCANVFKASDAPEGLIGKSGYNPARSRHCIQEAVFR